MTIFKQSTPYTHQFLMVDATSHTSGATGKSTTLVVKLGKNGATGVTAGGALAEVDSSNLPGVYSIVFSVTDVNTLGSLALAATASGCDPTNEAHQVSANIFSDVQLNAGGRVLIANNLQQNTALNGFSFPMTSTTTGQRLPSLTLTVQRSLGGAGFAPAVSTAGEIGGSGASGVYFLNIAAADINAGTSAFLVTATGANDLLIPLVPTP